MNTDRSKTALIAITWNGVSLGRKLELMLPESHLYIPDKFANSTDSHEFVFSGSSADVIRQAFQQYRYLILIMATGIAVRGIATELHDKKLDPGVVVIDEAGKSCISLISGHLGGANDLTNRVAKLIGATPVITTASDVSGTISIDMLGHDYGWEIEDTSRLTGASAAVVNGEPVGIYQDAGMADWDALKQNLPDNFTVVSSLDELTAMDYSAAVVITDRVIDKDSSLPEYSVIYRPKSLVIGLGCNRNTGAAAIEEAINHVLLQNDLSPRSIRLLTTIDIKNNEAGLLKSAREHNLPIEYHTREALRKTKFPSDPSSAAEKHVGTPSVCEGAALLSSQADILLVPKVKYNKAVTVAVARLNQIVRKQGKLVLVGTGPGNAEFITFQASKAIELCDTIAGYKTYISQVKDLIGNKEIISTGMGDEVKRVQDAVDHARSGKNVCLISGGDTGVYGMAALAYEMVDETPDIDIEVIPGITAVVAAASRLGSPVSVDFAVISLSDYLIPIKSIYKRLELAAEGDFVIALYNPRSKKRDSYLSEARNLIMKHRDPSTPVGFVTNACRDNEVILITNIENMLDYETDMNTIVIIGNSTTFVSRNRMITPRGYGNKYTIH